MLLSIPLAAADPPGRPPPTAHVERREVAHLEARDGTQLYTVTFVPSGDGPFPSVVTRVPYAMDPVLDVQCRILARRGYACAYQHVRGRGRSGGDWSPFVHEEADGQDFVTWIRARPWSDGQVAWLGDSYLAAAGWTVALQDPDGVSTLVSRIFAPSLYVSAYESGLLRHELLTAWMTIMPDSRERYLVWSDYQRALRHRPRTTMDVVAVGHEVPWFREWLLAEDPASPVWDRPDARAFQAAPENVSIPVLMVGGWSDAFVGAQFDAWSRLATQDRSLLVIGPWAHLGQRASAVPLRDVGAAGGATREALQALQLPRVIDWLDVHLRGREPRFPTTGVATYVVGGDRWEHRDAWPPATIERRFGAVAGTGPCDGTLGAEGPLDRAYVYDPEDPLPSRGGDGNLAGAIPLWKAVRPGFQRVPDRCERREDILRFESSPLAEPLHFAGALRVEMDVASDAADTAFGFRLLERRAGGPEFLLREGFVTLALRDGPPRRPYVPGERVRVTADATPLEAEVHAGSSLVLVLTSSSFPSYEAHPNTAGLLSAATTTRVARQQVFSATLVVPEVAGAR